MFGAGVGAALLGAAGCSTAATASPSAETTAGYGLWVGPEGSGAPFVIDPAAGAQQAINAALKEAGQGLVFVAGGTHEVKEPIVLGDRQKLVGAGPLGTLLRAAKGFSGSAMIRTPDNFTGSRMVIADIGLEGANVAKVGIDLRISGAPDSYGPDPVPWLHRVFVSRTTGDGVFLGGEYAGGQRDYKITDCRVEDVGGWAFNLESSDGMLSGCTAQGGKLGGYNFGGGNTRATSCKAFGTGDGDEPGPAFRIGSRASVVGCEAQDSRGCGFEIVGKGSTLSSCTADSTGIGRDGTDRYSAGFYVAADVTHLSGSSYQRAGGGGGWLDAKGMRWALYLEQGVDRVSIDLVSDGSMSDEGVYQGLVTGEAGSNSKVSVIG